MTLLTNKELNQYRFIGLYETFGFFIDHRTNDDYYPKISRLLRDNKITKEQTFNLLKTNLEDIKRKEEYSEEEFDEYLKELDETVINAYNNGKGIYTYDDLLDDLINNEKPLIEAKIIIETIKELLEYDNLVFESDQDLKDLIDEKIKKTQIPYALIGEYLQKKYEIIKHEETREPYILQKEGGYRILTDVGLHIILNNEWPNKFSIEHSEKIIGYFADYKTPKETIIQFKNCYLDLETLTVIPLSKNEFTQRHITWDYNPDAESLILEEELKKMLKEHYNLFLQMIGYSFLSHHKDEKLFFLIGYRGTGKTTLRKILTNIFGYYNISNIPLQNISQNDFQSANIIGKTMNIVDDTNLGRISDVGLLNSISSGSAMSFNPKYKKTIQVSGSSLPKLLILGNSLPIIKDPAGAIYERIVLMKTHKKFRATANCDTDFIDTLTFKDYEWLIKEGIIKYNELEWPNKAEEIEGLYNIESDPVSVAIDVLYDLDYNSSDDINQAEIMEKVNDQLKKFFEDGLIVSKPKLTVKELNNKMVDFGSHRVYKRVTEDEEEIRFHAFKFLERKPPKDDIRHYLYKKAIERDQSP